MATSSQLDFEVDYFDIVCAFQDQGVNNILSEMQHLNPLLYSEIENYFKFREADKKLGVLLDASVSRRECSRMESYSMVSNGSNSDPGTKQ